MLLTLSEAARLLERKRGKKVHWSTLRRWGQSGRFRLHFVNGWKVCETEFTDWASRAGKLRKKSGGGRDIEARFVEDSAAKALLLQGTLPKP